MELLIPLWTLLVVGLASAEPSTTPKLVDSDARILYNSTNNIVKIYMPINSFYNYYSNLPESERMILVSPKKIFFVEADTTGKEKVIKGAYVFYDGKIIKILDNGADVISTQDDRVFIGATDGIYKYNDKNDTAVKLRSVQDNIVKMTHDNTTDRVVYINNKKELFVLSKDLESSRLVPSPHKIEQIQYDNSGFLYFYTAERELYASKDGVETKFEGLPNTGMVNIVRPRAFMKDGVFVVVDRQIYILNPDASFENTNTQFAVQPTALAPEAIWFQYYASNKQLCETLEYMSM